MLSAVVEPRFAWRVPAEPRLDAGLLAAAASRGIPERLLGLLVRRGVASVEELDAFFAAPEAGLHDPRRLPDADVLLQRLRRARATGERLLVLGDFDADGLTGLAILTLVLRGLGLDARPYVPRRVEEGHGLSAAAVEVARADGRSLIVTVDCGTSSRDEIASAVRHGIDVIVTDHHHVPAEVPAALALVNPHRADSDYPDRRLTGSGIAFKVAQLLLADEPGGATAALELTDLATIGTVADVAPILGENRSIARLGLARLRAGLRPGLAALLARAGVAPAVVDLETIGFSIAPRLNAAGRVGEADDAAALLLTAHPEEAATLAAALETANATRRDVTRVALTEALAAIERDPAVAEAPATVVRGPWPVGIVGLVAARLVEERGRPAVVASDLGPTLRASCRTAEGFDLAAALEACGDLFERYGGHPGAAGFELEPDRWDTFRSRFGSLAARASAATARRTLDVDLVVDAPDVGYGLLGELATLAPTGPGNPDPLVAIRGLGVARVRAATGGHTQLTLRREKDVLDGIAFGWADLAEAVREGDRVDVVARLASRRFGGFESLQLEIRDVGTSGGPWFAPASAARLPATGLPAAAPLVHGNGPGAVPAIAREGR